MIQVFGIGSVILLGIVLGPLLVPDMVWPSFARDFLTINGLPNTGASNMVSAIYLGFRAYDTVGETIVLLAAVSSALHIIKDASDGPGEVLSATKTRINRTNIINLTTGKLAPVVLLFGWYVMFFGHQSPGGGFQGGVVLASGLLFISLGRETHQADSMLSRGVLKTIEALSFIGLLVLVSFPLCFGATFLENPFDRSAVNIPKIVYIIGFNAVIGLKVGSGLALLGLLMMDMKHGD